MNLCSELKDIYDYEIAHGNEVERIDAPAGTDCPLCIVFKLKLKFIASQKKLDETVLYWECNDPYYPSQAGYSEQRTKQVICGPM